MMMVTPADAIECHHLPEELLTIHTEDHTIHVYSANPLCREELEYKLEHGINKLLEKFDALELSEIVDTDRISTCT